MKRWILVGTALAVAAALAWLDWKAWFYLQRGYSLGISMNGHPGSVYHVAFPRWRAAVHLLLWISAMVSTFSYVTARRWASAAACLTLAVAVIVGMNDVTEYGFLGSPTSIWAVLLLLMLALLTRLEPLLPRATE